MSEICQMVYATFIEVLLYDEHGLFIFFKKKTSLKLEQNYVNNIEKNDQAKYARWNKVLYKA